MTNLATIESSAPVPQFSSADMGALAHLYRAEVYRSTMWRTRLDNTTNWGVASLGLAISVTFSSREASPLPLLLVGILISFFLIFEARRYRYFNVWRTRARWMEHHFYAPMLQGGPVLPATSWANCLAKEYDEPLHRISLVTAIHRRLTRTYVWILCFQGVAYFGKLSIHPTTVHSLHELTERAAVGPISGRYVLVIGLVFNVSIIVFCLFWPAVCRVCKKRSGDPMKDLVDSLPPDLA